MRNWATRMGDSENVNPIDVEAVRKELSREWSGGSRILVEDLIQRLGHSMSSADVAVKLIQHEVNLRCKHGEPIDVGELVSRFPQVDSDILHELIELPPPPPALTDDSVLFPQRYRRMQLIGEGGLGKVWRVFDQRMERPLAIKVAKQTNPRNRELANIRLQREAILTGSLQHPGIPPVFDHGKLNDGSEFFAMKIVEGQTLADILEQRNRDGFTESTDIDLASLIGVFAQIAQTVAYAHSQQIVHRDLKPHNVMVGQFGEVQVMDWGMGKSLSDLRTSVPDRGSQPEKLAKETETVSRSVDSSLAESVGADPFAHLTRTGEVLGTPAYMPPEQARGEIDSIGTASDVFGLGAILFTMLTGQHLYASEDPQQVMAKAKSGDLKGSIALLTRSQVDPELQALCIDCLQPFPADRPADGAVVAERVTEHQQGVSKRLEQARSDQLSAEVRATEERKRRFLTSWLSAAIIGAVLVGLVGVWWQWDKAQQATLLAETRLDDSQQATRLAIERLQETREVVDEYYSTISDARGLLSRTPGTQELRRELLEKAQKYYVNFVEKHGESREARFESAHANQRLAQIVQELNPGSEKVLTARMDQIATLQTLIEETQAEPQEQYFEFLADAQYALGLAYASKSDFDNALIHFSDAEQTLLRWVEFTESDHARFQLSKTQHNYGQVLGDMGEKQKALAYYEKALARAEPILANAKPDDDRLADYAQNVGTMNLTLGTHYGWKHKTGRSWAKALQHTQVAINLYEKAARIEPNNLQHQQLMVSALNNVGMIHYNNVVKGESRKDRIERCRATFDRAATTCQTMIDQNKGVPEYVRLLANQLGNYCTFLHHNKDAEGSKNKMRQSAELYKQIALAHPQVTEYADNAIFSLEFFAALDGTTEAAELAISDAVGIFKQLVAQTPEDDQNRVQFALRLAVLDQADATELLQMTSSVDSNKKPADSRLAARALAYLRNDELHKAIECLGRVPARKEFAMRWLVRALVYQQLGDVEKASEFFKKATRKMDEQKTASDRDYYKRHLQHQYLELVPKETDEPEPEAESPD